uniref:Uncharacterized protein n=1 Tax=Avena sativa TaxID=4498 RepID=A0ACD6AM30_AVESA
MAEVADASGRATAGASISPTPAAGSGDRKRARSPVLPPPPPGPPPSAAHKRQRAEGGGFDRRRLGGVQDDRRFGNDHGGQGRHNNRAPDWHDSGRGGWSEGSGNSRREGLMSYKQFMQELEDDVLPVEAQRRYEEYKSEYITTQKKAYFELHKNEDWLRNKYHPTNLESVMERRNELARATANEFFQDLQSGSLDTSPGLTNKSGNIDGLEGVELLDTLVTYLWRIHGVDYYGMFETNEPKGLRHVKADSRTYDGASSNTAEWEEKLDSFWQDRIQGQDPLEILKAKEKIDTAASEVLDPYVRKIRDEKYGWKYGCGAKGCTKLFHASEFVTKHLKLKHTDFVVELTAKVREDIYFENYMTDPKAPGGTPIMQQSAPREKVRQRPPIESRLRDERGRRFDRNGDSPNHDGSSENPDDPMHDAYGDPAMHGAFPSDIPAPPMLMPVPGAGPLGPFIPAPPEVAMRMLREQGGPPPFEPTAGPRPRKAGRGGGPPMSGPSPMFNAPLPPLMHDPRMQDPRKIRSYQDLDAPGDEVTVLDYRSL